MARLDALRARRRPRAGSCECVRMEPRLRGL